MAHVFAGLAARELAHQQRAREHYKTAIALQPEEQLAWKVDLSIFKFNLSISQPINQTSIVVIKKAWVHHFHEICFVTLSQYTRPETIGYMDGRPHPLL